MVCKRPFSGRFGCGRCLPCRILRRGDWVHRCLLETFLHKQNSFVTLTYEQSYLPEGGNLRKEDVQGWLKRLRERLDYPIRYYGCGEYGGETWRPHYHFILFGYPPCVAPPPARVKRIQACPCQPCKLIQETWYQGFSDLRFAERKSIQYVAGYVTEFKTKEGDPRLGGRRPERPFMSRRPGIGANAMFKVTEALTTKQGSDELLINGDVPSVLMHGNKKFPVGRFLKNKIRKFYGFPERRSIRGTVSNTPEGAMLKLSQEKRAQFEALVEQEGSFGRAIQMEKEIRLQKVLNVETKYHIFKKQGGI